MYKKIIIATVLIAFVCIQLGYTLQCHECASPSECKRPNVKTCDQRAGNSTNKNLAKYFINVNNNTSNNFDCLHLNGTENNVNTVEIRGCIFLNANPCSLTNQPAHATLVKRNCTICSANLCNGRNPAGSVSSSLHSLLASSLMVFAAKILKS